MVYNSFYCVPLPKIPLNVTTKKKLLQFYLNALDKKKNIYNNLIKIENEQLNKEIEVRKEKEIEKEVQRESKKLI